MSEPHAAAGPLVVQALDHLVLNVRDVEATVAWYVRVLGMTRRDFAPGEGKPPRASLVFGTQKMNVRPISADKRDWFTGDNVASGSEDLCFLTGTGPDQVVAHLRACGVTIELGPVEKEGARGRLRSVYCRDPDGSLIEISSYA
jgi:catechol 2,3-dioxygenase-like lactoylglutathione lyase family enzyme